MYYRIVGNCPECGGRNTLKKKSHVRGLGVGRRVECLNHLCKKRWHNADHLVDNHLLRDVKILRKKQFVLIVRPYKNEIPCFDVIANAMHYILTLKFDLKIKENGVEGFYKYGIVNLVRETKKQIGLRDKSLENEPSTHQDVLDFYFRHIKALFFGSRNRKSVLFSESTAEVFSLIRKVIVNLSEDDMHDRAIAASIEDIVVGLQQKSFVCCK